MYADQWIITANNSSQNIGPLDSDRPNALGNLSVENPTVEQINAAFAASAAVTETKTECKSKSEPLFGTHIREAAAIVKDWVG